MTESKGKILAIDDNEDILFALKLLLKPHVEEIDTFNSPDNVLDQLRKKDYDLILLGGCGVHFDYKNWSTYMLILNSIL